jgi:hypothetical protein
MLPTFMHGNNVLGGDLKKLSLKNLQEGHEDTYDVSCQSLGEVIGENFRNNV